MTLDRSHDIGLDAAGTGLSRILPGGSGSRAKRVKQAVLCLLKTNEGEAFTDGTHGIPWFDRVLTLPETHLDLAKRILEEKILAVDGVRRIRTLTLETDGRNLSGTISVECDGGEVAEAGF